MEQKTMDIDVGANGTKQDARNKARAQCRENNQTGKVRSAKRDEKKKNIFHVVLDIKDRKISEKKSKKAKKTTDKKSAVKAAPKKAEKKAAPAAEVKTEKLGNWTKTTTPKIKAKKNAPAEVPSLIPPQ